MYLRRKFQQSMDLFDKMQDTSPDNGRDTAYDRDTERHEPTQPTPLSKKTTKELWVELCHLILLLLWAITKKIIRVTYKSIRFTYRFIKKCIEATIVWWNDKSTQEKVRSIRRKTRIYSRHIWKWTKNGIISTCRTTVQTCRLIVRYTFRGIVAVFKGLAWTLVTLVQLIIHMKPTIIRLRHSYKEWRRRVARGRKLKQIRKSRQHEAFKRSGGFRGALERKTASLKASIQSYMEEEQSETTPDAITEDDILEERFEQIEQDNKAQIIGKKFFSSIKNIVEEDS